MTRFPINEFANQATPFYFYDIDLLESTLATLIRAKNDDRFKVHYAIKANANPLVLEPIRQAGLGVDVVSGYEIKAALDAGFDPAKIVFAGVAKTDPEIAFALDNRIGCFNVESLPEIDAINAIAKQKGVVADVAIRVNPNVDAHTHHYITTGLSENKFGIDMTLLDSVIDHVIALDNLKLVGLHFHIGSQITEFEPYRLLCQRINELQAGLAKRGVRLPIINVGGGLGIDYADPDRHPIADFASYFAIFRANLVLAPDQEAHFELGRSIVAQCGSLIARCVYVKKGVKKQFAILDAGMTELIRPALYQAHHKIQNLSSPQAVEELYDVVGPICESSDIFGKDELLPQIKRGDIVALRSAGAYGEVMASRYNQRPLPPTFNPA